MEQDTIEKEIEYDKESLERRLIAYEVSDEGRCWWIYEYLSAPPLKVMNPLEVGFAQKDIK